MVEARGIDVRGQFVFEQTGENLTRIAGWLFVNSKGILGWFLPERTVRERRRKKLRSDLEDLRQRFRE